MKKSLAALVLASSIALVSTAPAIAASYPPAPPVPGQAAVSDGTVGPGEQFFFRGRGPFAGETLTIQVTPGNPPAASGGAAAGSRSVGTRINLVTETQTLKGTADVNGDFSVPITINESGVYFLTATGNTSGNTVGPVRIEVDPKYATDVASSAGDNKDGASASDNNNKASGALASTGADSGLILWTLVGAGALAAGAASVVVVRRRAKTEAAA